MRADQLRQVIRHIRDALIENREWLTEVDAQSGDGDLGISMEQGFSAVAAHMESSAEQNLGRLMMGAAMVLNEASPSSLGTILSMGMMGGSKQWADKSEIGVSDAAAFFQAMVESIMERSRSKPGEKTILDALVPAAKALAAAASEGLDSKQVFSAAARAAADGCEATRSMRAVHGRAAYYAEKSIGRLDGGAIVGKIIFEAIYESLLHADQSMRMYL